MIPRRRCTMDEEQLVLERNRLIGKVAARHGIRIDEEDPAFYVLSLNEFALDEATKTIVERIQGAGQGFESAFERVQQRAGEFFAQQIKQHDVGPARKGSNKPSIEWIAVWILTAFLIFVSGIIVGIAIKWN